MGYPKCEIRPRARIPRNCPDRCHRPLEDEPYPSTQSLRRPVTIALGGLFPYNTCVTLCVAELALAAGNRAARRQPLSSLRIHALSSECIDANNFANIVAAMPSFHTDGLQHIWGNRLSTPYPADSNYHPAKSIRILTRMTHDRQGTLKRSPKSNTPSRGSKDAIRGISPSAFVVRPGLSVADWTDCKRS